MHRVRHYGRQTWAVAPSMGLTCLGVGLGLPMTTPVLAASPRQPANRRNRAPGMTQPSTIQREGIPA